MAKIGWAVIANAVLNNQNNQPVLDSPIVSIDLPVVPNNFSFSLAFCAIDMIESKKYILDLKIFEPSNDAPLVSGEIGLDHKYDLSQKNSSFFSDVGFQNFQFNEFGIHRIELKIEEDSEPFTIYFEVRQRLNGPRK